MWPVRGTTIALGVAMALAGCGGSTPPAETPNPAPRIITVDSAKPSRVGRDHDVLAHRLGIPLMAIQPHDAQSVYVSAGRTFQPDAQWSLWNLDRSQTRPLRPPGGAWQPTPVYVDSGVSLWRSSSEPTLLIVRPGEQPQSVRFSGAGRVIADVRHVGIAAGRIWFAAGVDDEVGLWSAPATGGEARAEADHVQAVAATGDWVAWASERTVTVRNVKTEVKRRIELSSVRSAQCPDPYVLRIALAGDRIAIGSWCSVDDERGEVFLAPLAQPGHHGPQTNGLRFTAVDAVRFGLSDTALVTVGKRAVDDRPDRSHSVMVWSMSDHDYRIVGAASDEGPGPAIRKDLLAWNAGSGKTHELNYLRLRHG